MTYIKQLITINWAKITIELFLVCVFALMRTTYASTYMYVYVMERFVIWTFAQ